MRKKKIFVIAIAASAVIIWWAWPGCVSYCNFWRIQNGMSRLQVESLLGSAGTEAKSIPEFPPYIQLPEAPAGCHNPVWGDTFIKWSAVNGDIWVGFSEGGVISKYY